jgi:hypothetical protein
MIIYVTTDFFEFNRSSMPKKIHFQVKASSSADENYPASTLEQHGPFVNGWRTTRSCSYPQELLFQFDQRTHLKRIQLLSHEYLIRQLTCRVDSFILIDVVCSLVFSIENRIFCWP